MAPKAVGSSPIFRPKNKHFYEKCLFCYDVGIATKSSITDSTINTAAPAAGKPYTKWLLPLLPLVITVVAFSLAQVFTTIVCNVLPTASRGECGLGWLWLLLGPLFALMFIGSLVFALAAFTSMLIKGIGTMRKERKQQ